MVISDVDNSLSETTSGDIKVFTSVI